MSALGHTLTSTAADLKPGENQIRAVKNGQGPLYVRLTGYVHRDVDFVDAAGKIGVVREYLNADTGTPLDSGYAAMVGDLVRVKLSVQVPDESWYVIVENHLPAGLGLERTVGDDQLRGTRVWGRGVQLAEERLQSQRCAG